MDLEDSIRVDLDELLAEHGVGARWNGLDLMVLAGRASRDQNIEIGGFVDAPDLSIRVPSYALPAAGPKNGDRVTVDGDGYRVVRVSRHPRSPLVTLVLAAADE